MRELLVMFAAFGWLTVETSPTSTWQDGSPQPVPQAQRPAPVASEGPQGAECRRRIH